jgi:hypothetical protein
MAKKKEITETETGIVVSEPTETRREVIQPKAGEKTVTIRMKSRWITDGGKMIYEGVMTLPATSSALKDLAGEYTIIEG